MKIILICFIMYLNASLIIAQNEPDNSIRRPTNNIYLNLLGDASIFSINYEKLFLIDKGFALSSKIGLGYNQADPVCISFGSPCPAPPKFLTIPLHISGNLGKGKRMFEIGVGGTFFTGNENKKMKLYPIVGYRLQPIESKKFTFRIFTNLFNPAEFFNYDNILLSPVGISLGISF